MWTNCTVTDLYLSWLQQTAAAGFPLKFFFPQNLNEISLHESRKSSKTFPLVSRIKRSGLLLPPPEERVVPRLKSAKITGVLFGVDGFFKLFSRFHSGTLVVWEEKDREVPFHPPDPTGSEQRPDQQGPLVSWFISFSPALQFKRLKMRNAESKQP